MVNKYHFSNIIGRSEAIKGVFALMTQAIDSDSDVLITGETGTGKELVARAIHENSSRKDKPLFAISCGTVPKEVLVSELFGHCKGAFSGAIEEKVGLFEAATGSTLILDDIGDMPFDVQPDLLRVLIERKVQRLGETASRPVDVRVIAISNRNLTKLVETGDFLSELYARFRYASLGLSAERTETYSTQGLKAFEIHLPPLRERLEDIPLLAEHFYEEAYRQRPKILDGFAADVLKMLLNYHWPGNVRELRNAVRRAYALAEEGERIRTDHFPPQIIRRKPET